MYKLISASSILIFLLFLLPACNKSATTTSPSSNNSSGSSSNNNNGGNNNNGNNGGNTTPTYGFSVKIDGVLYTASFYHIDKRKDITGQDMFTLAARIPYKGQTLFSATLDKYGKVKTYRGGIYGDTITSCQLGNEIDSSIYTPSGGFYYVNGNDVFNITFDNGTYVSGTFYGTYYKDTMYNGYYVKPVDSVKVTEGKFTIKY
ncbi:MAG: hypothetical protein JST70_08815 [Bacteroidetes bacterium]|nr:hypothetical protein [Bacteroidota bacterium]